MKPGPSVPSSRIVALYRSAGHNFVGHHGREPSCHVMERVPFVDCVAGRGIWADRFFDHRPEFKGQITFFANEVHEAVTLAFGITPDPSVYRRNVITGGVDLRQWIGCRFRIQGIVFEGVEECRPCYWMDHVVKAGLEDFLRGRGGLRARILTDGRLTEGALTTDLTP